MTTTPDPIAAESSGLDRKAYGRLLARFSPKAIRNSAEHNAALSIVESLMEKGDNGRSQEEDTLLDLICDLIGQYEARIYEPEPDASPVDALKALMESHSLRPIDLADLLGGRSRISDILAGKRAISREQAKKLGDRFHLSPAAFL